MYTAISCKIYLCRGNHSYLYFPHNIVSVMYVFFLCYRKVDGIDYTAKVGRVPVSQGAKISWQTLRRKSSKVSCEVIDRHNRAWAAAFCRRARVRASKLYLNLSHAWYVTQPRAVGRGMWTSGRWGYLQMDSSKESRVEALFRRPC